ncbi:MAG: hypothetical protein ACI8ZN_002595 [Bacteroidia bacterium]|jgi:hypothetical protein
MSIEYKDIDMERVDKGGIVGVFNNQLHTHSNFWLNPIYPALKRWAIDMGASSMGLLVEY